MVLSLFTIALSLVIAGCGYEIVLITGAFDKKGVFYGIYL